MDSPNDPTLRVVFMGCPDFAVPIFEAVADAFDVVAAVAQPDRRAGRGRKLQPQPVKVRALERDIPVLQPKAVKTKAWQQQLADLEADVFVVAAYGRLLTQAVLDTPRLGCWNVHGSLLPAWRGAAPIQWSLIAGDAETGITIMRMDAGMDTGDIAMQRRTTIQVDDTVESLSARLAALGAEAIVEALRQLQAGTLETTPQDHAQATVAPMLTKADGRLRFDGAACDLCCRARGVDPWPGAHARLGDGDDAPMVKLFAPRPVAPDAEGGGEPGEIMGLDDHGLVIACGEDRVSFAEVQLPGRKRLPAQAVLAGQKIKIGDKLT